MSIRTTVTLDEDVFERTMDLSKARGIPFRQALNDLVRAGISMQEVTEKLLEEGIQVFADAFTALLAAIDQKKVKA